LILAVITATELTLPASIGSTNLRKQSILFSSHIKIIISLAKSPGAAYARDVSADTQIHTVQVVTIAPRRRSEIGYCFIK